MTTKRHLLALINDLDNDVSVLSLKLESLQNEVNRLAKEYSRDTRTATKNKKS